MESWVRCGHFEPQGWGPTYTKSGAIIFTTRHIVPFGKFQRVGGAPPKTFPNVKYDAPEELGGDKKCFYSRIRK